MFKKKADCIDDVTSIHASIIAKQFDSTVFDIPSVIFVVPKASTGGNMKHRNVYCPPLAVTVLEMYFGINICDFFVKNENSSCVIGHGQAHLYGLNIDYTGYHKQSGDYSSFDQAIDSQLIALSFEIIKSRLSFESDYHSELFDKLVAYVMFCHVYHPTVGTIRRSRGIISGSVFTNLVDSIVNLITINYALITTKQD